MNRLSVGFSQVEKVVRGIARTFAPLGVTFAVSFVVSLIARRFFFTHDPVRYPDASDNGVNGVNAFGAGATPSAIITVYKWCKYDYIGPEKFFFITQSGLGILLGVYCGTMIGHILDHNRIVPIRHKPNCNCSPRFRPLKMVFGWVRCIENRRINNEMNY